VPKMYNKKVIQNIREKRVSFPKCFCPICGLTMAKINRECNLIKCPKCVISLKERN